MSAAVPSPRLPERAARQPLGALRHRNYQLFFGGQVVSTVGTWMQSIAQSWLVLELTHSAFLVGLVLAIQFLPMLLAVPLGGLAADRYPKRRLLMLTQALFMVPALFLFAITWAHVAQVWMVMAAAFCYGWVNVFDVPARQSFVVEMVGRDDLMNAIALNSAVFNGAAVVGPSIAGVLIGAAGVQACFLVNAVSFVAAITALAAMRNLPTLVGAGGDRQPAGERLRQGARYAIRDPVVGTMLLVIACLSLFAMNRLTLIPLFADQVLHIGAAGFGFLMGAFGFGSLVGALTLAFFGSAPDGRRQFWVAVAWAIALVAFSLSRTPAASAALLFVVGFCQISFLATANARIQSLTPDDLRGRVMAFYAQALIGVGPLGSALAGALAGLFGAPVAMAAGAGIAALVVLLVRTLRPAVFTLDSGAA
jgi:MFS family permease